MVMRMLKLLRVLFVGSALVSLLGCSTTKSLPSNDTPLEETNTEPISETVEASTVEEAPVSEEELMNRWVHLEGPEGKYVGVGTDRLYATNLSGKKPKRTVIVAVIDSGIDIEHEDLRNVIWVNEDEVPGNNIDDDQNGFIDDRNGWNFIGGPNGEQVSYDTFEVTRELVRLRSEFNEVDVALLSEEKRKEYEYYQNVISAYEEERVEMANILENVDGFVSILMAANSIMSDLLGKTDYTIEDVQDVESDREEVQQAKSILMYFDGLGISREQVMKEREKIQGYLEKGLNPDFDPRHIVGDNYEDPHERVYGNNLVEGPDAQHGTHVAGIIAAQRNNGIGADGIANNVQIMPIRAVPNGDERDKDIANAIRYAVDNGAHIINMSFGKGFSPYKAVVDEAVIYAEENNVLIVKASGNDAENNDEVESYPSRMLTREERGAENWIEVGASNWESMDALAASFSNYGKKNVDLFAPGVQIFSSVPDNQYELLDGTSMAAPVVSGVAALIMGYYPTLTAVEVKDILVDSAVSFSDEEVLLPGSEDQFVAFGSLSRTGGIANAYHALKLAEERSK